MSEPLPLDQFVERQLASGRYPSKEALVEEALRLLQEHEEEEERMSGEGTPNSTHEDEAVPPSQEARKPLWEKIRDAFSDVPEEELESLPVDGAAQVDHYAYGLPKR